MALQDDVPEANLVWRDRFEASPHLWDWAELLHCNQPAFMMWRQSQETICHHRNPLFEAGHIEFEEVLALDTMHTLCLGLHGQYVAHCVWRLIQANVLGSEATYVEDRAVETCMILQRGLSAFYKAHKTDATLTQMERLRPDMFGTQQKPFLKAKAGETLWMLRFLVDAVHGLPAMGEFPGKGAWVSCGKALVQWWDIMKCGPLVLPAGQVD
eukprot:2263069-Amphidinium_carterae.1